MPKPVQSYDEDDKYNKLKYYSQSPSLSSTSESEPESELESVSQAGIMSEIPSYPTSQAMKPGRLSLPGLMTLPPAEGGAEENGLIICYLKCKVQQMIMSLMS